MICTPSDLNKEIKKNLSLYKTKLLLKKLDNPTQELNKLLKKFKENYSEFETSDILKAVIEESQALKLLAANGLSTNVNFFNIDTLKNILLGNAEVQISSTENRALADPKKAASAALVKKDFLVSAYGHATKIRTDVEKAYTKNLVDAVIINRKTGSLVLNTEDLNTNIREYQQLLLDDVINYLEYSAKDKNGHKSRTIGFTTAELEELKSTKMYDNNGNYTKILDKVLAVLNKMTINLSPNSITADILINWDSKPTEESQLTLKAYNSWLVLNNIDLVISSLFGKSVIIKDFGIFTSNLEKYLFSTNLSNLITTWRTNEEYNVEDEVSDIVKLLVQTTPKYTADGLLLQNTYLTFGDFNYITAAIKSLIFNPSLQTQVFDDTLLSTQNAYGQSMQTELSENTLKLIENKTFNRLIADAKINPQKYWPVIYELLANDVTREILGNLNLNDVEVSIIKSLHLGIFSESEGSILNIYRNTDTDLNNTNFYYAYITQVADAIYEVKYIQYYQDENGHIRPRYLKDSALDDIKRDIENSLKIKYGVFNNQAAYLTAKQKYNTAFRNSVRRKLNSDDLKNFAEHLDGNHLVDAQIKPTKVEFTLGNTTIEIDLSNFNTRNALNRISEEEKLNLILDILNVNFRDLAYSAAAKSIGLTSNDLALFAIQILANQAVANEIFTNVTANELETVANNFYGKDSTNLPRMDRALNLLSSISQKDAYTLEKMAKVEAITKGLMTSTQQKGGEGNTYNSTSLSRLLGSHYLQFELQGKAENSAVKNCLLLSNPNIYKGVVTAKEVKLIDGTTEHKDWNSAEFVASELIHDFLGGFLTGNENNVFNNYVVGFLPSVNSDKNTINRILIDLKAIVNGKALYKHTNTELKALIAREITEIYTNIYTNIESEVSRAFALVIDELKKGYLTYLDSNFPGWELTLSENNYANDFIYYNTIIDSINNTFATKFTPYSFLRLVVTNHNINPVNRNSLITLTDLMHYINVGGQLKNNRALMHLINARFATVENSNEFWRNKNAEIISSLAGANFNLNIQLELFEKNLIGYLNATSTTGNKEARINAYKLNWINSSGNLILGKIGTTPIATRMDLVNLAINEGKHPNYYINNPHELAAKGVVLNPMIEHYNLLDYLFTLEYVTATVGTYLAHPNKKLPALDALSIQHDEATRVAALNKRNVQNTAAMHPFLLNQLTGIPRHYNVAVIEDIKAILYNVSGDVADDVKPFDGATYVNPFVVLLENNSLDSAKAGLTKKLFVHFYDERTSSGGIIKTAGFPLTNDLMRNNLFDRRLMKKMTSGIWTTQNGDFYVTDVLKDYNGKAIKFGEQFLQHRGQYYKLKLQKVNGDNAYERYLFPVNSRGTVIGMPIKVDLDNNITSEPVIINSNYTLWQAFGAMNSMELNRKTKTLESSETSIHNVVEVMNNNGIRLTEGKVETLDDLYQPLKHSDIHYAATAGAVKQGAANINANSVFYDDTPLNFMRIRMHQAGILLDKEHHADESELSLMTQVINACSARGYTIQQATNLYKALSTLTINGTALIREAFSEYFVAADNGIKFEEVILNTVIQALTKLNIDESNILSAIASDLISKAQTGEVLKFKSDLEGVFPCSNNDVFNKLLSTISVVLTKAGIKQKIPGLLAVLTPSHTRFKLYDGKKYESILNNKEGLSEEEYLNQLQANAPTIYKVYEDGKVYFSNHLLRLERTYLAITADGMETKITLNTPQERKVFKERIISGEFIQVNEYVKEGRNLGAYDVLFKGTFVGENDLEEFTLYDLDSILNLFYIKDLKTIEQIRNAAVNFGVEIPMELALNFAASKKYLYNKLLNKVLKDLFLLSPTAIKRIPTIRLDINNLITKIGNGTADISTLQAYLKDNCNISIREGEDVITAAVNLLESFKSANFIQINGKDITVDTNSIDVLAYECIMPKTFATAFGLSKFDSLEDILNDANYFYNKLASMYKPTEVLNNNFTLEFKRISGEHVYVLDQTALSKSEGLVKIPITKINDNGKLYRTDINGLKMYELSSDEDTIYALLDENGLVITEIICSNNLQFYADHFDYAGINIANTDNKKVIDKVTNVLKSSKNKVIKNFYRIVSDTTLEGTNIFTHAIELLKTVQYSDNPLNEVLRREGREIHSTFLQSLNVVAARIPAQSMQSFMPMKIVAFDNPDINSAYVSIAQIWLQGSDFDIDAVSLATYDVNSSGKLDLWSPYTNLETLKGLEQSLQLPFPSGKKVVEHEVENEEEFTNWLFDIYNNFSNIFEGTIVNTSNLEVVKKLLEFIDANGVYKLKDASQKQLASEILQIHPEKVESLLQNIVNVVNDHNLYLTHKSEKLLQRIANNFTITSMLLTIKDPVNLIQALTSVDGTTKPFKDRANNSETTEVLKLASPGNFVTKVSGIEENHTSSSCIGISAVGMKSYFALTLYYNSVLNEGTKEELERLLFNVTIQGKDYHMLSNVRTQHYKTVFVEKAREYLRRLDQNSDAAIALSAILSLATDNAKELCLAKLNAGKKALDMYIYALSIGVDFETVADIMTSSIVMEMFKLMEGNLFTSKDAMYNISQAFNYVENGPVHLNGVLKQRLLNDDGTESKETVLDRLVRVINSVIYSSDEYADKKIDLKSSAHDKYQRIINLAKYVGKNGYKVNLGKLKIKTSNGNVNQIKNLYLINQVVDELIQFLYINSLQRNDEAQNSKHYYNDLKTLALGAFELKALGRILKLNQGLPTKADEILSMLDNFENILINLAEEYAKITGLEVSTPDRIDIQKFIEDMNYREDCIKSYESIKHTFNILDCITKVPHFKEYLHILSLLDAAAKRIALKWRFVRKQMPSVSKSLHISSKKAKTKTVKGLSDFISDWMRKLFFFSKGLTFTIPVSNTDLPNYFYDVRGELTEVKDVSVPLLLGKDNADTSYKRYFESYIVAKLQLDYPNNIFIQNLQSNIFTNAVGHNPYVGTSLTINMLPKTEVDRNLFALYKAAFNEIANVSFINHDGNSYKIVDLFAMYDMITFMSKNGSKSLHSILQNHHNKKSPNLITEFEEFIAHFDSDLSRVNPEIFTLDDFANWIALIDYRKASKNSPEYRYHRDSKDSPYKLQQLIETKAGLEFNEDDDGLDPYELNFDDDYTPTQQEKTVFEYEDIGANVNYLDFNRGESQLNMQRTEVVEFEYDGTTPIKYRFAHNGTVVVNAAGQSVEFKLSKEDIDALGVVVDGTIENLNLDILESLIVNKLNC